MNEPRRIGEIFQEVAERFRDANEASERAKQKMTELREMTERFRLENAQAGLERERNAYWIRKNAEKVARQGRPSRDERAAARKPVPNRADMRANQGGGMTWSQRHRPARPSDTIARAERAKVER